MDVSNALRIFTVLTVIHAINGQRAEVSGPTEAAIGTNASLTCTVVGGTANVIQWYDDSTNPPETIYVGSTPFSQDLKYRNFKITSLSTTGSVLTIKNAEVEDDGVYRCDIPIGTDGTISVEVEAASTLTLTLDSIVTGNMDMYQATCDAVGGKPQETITWTLNGIAQTDGNGNTIEETNPPATPPLSNTRSVFTFPATPENNRQTLVCETTGHTLTELNGQQSRNLDIHSSPSDTGTTVTVDYVTQGTSSIRVSCNAANEPLPTMRNYYIYSNDMLIHESTDGNNQVTVQDPVVGTNYTCLAGNYLGNTSSEAVTYDPAKPISGISGVSAGIAVLTILLVASIIINVIQFILLRRHGTTPECKESPETLSSEDRQLSSKANDNTAYEMDQSGDRAYTALKLGPSGSSSSSVIAPENLMFFTRLGSIGRGDFGAVWKGVLRSDQGQVDVAIRQIPDQVNRSADVLQAFKVLCDLSDQLNIVKCLGYCQQQGSILYEFISGGTLLTHLQMTGVQSQPTYTNLKPNRVRIDEGSLLNFAWQIAKGMQFLASKRIIHGTLCAHNVLLDERKKCQISDYGLASSLFSKTSKPTRWSSPETMVSGVQSTEGDIWSFGIVLWEIVTLGARPYPNMAFDRVQKEVTDGYKMPCPRHCGQELYAIMSLCWENEPRNRSNFDRILRSLERILEKNHNYLSLNNLDEGLYASALDM